MSGPSVHNISLLERAYQMDANVYPEPASVGLAHCVHCGAPLHIGVANCVACGLPVSVAAGAPTSPPAAADPATLPAAGDPATPPSAQQDLAIADMTMRTPTAGQAPIAQPPQPTGPMYRCNWCGAMNPAGVDRCASCNATFPKAEQDDLLNRASRERVRLAMQDLEEIDRKRSRSFLARLFG